ncbi:hypothetical protein QQ045_006311 [Rhodiola kirilowii]
MEANSNDVEIHDGVAGIKLHEHDGKGSNGIQEEDEIEMNHDASAEKKSNVRTPDSEEIELNFDAHPCHGHQGSDASEPQSLFVFPDSPSTSAMLLAYANRMHDGEGSNEIQAEDEIEMNHDASAEKKSNEVKVVVWIIKPRSQSEIYSLLTPDSEEKELNFDAHPCHGHQGSDASEPQILSVFPDSPSTSAMLLAYARRL